MFDDVLSGGRHSKRFQIKNNDVVGLSLFLKEFVVASVFIESTKKQSKMLFSEMCSLTAGIWLFLSLSPTNERTHHSFLLVFEQQV